MERQRERERALHVYLCVVFYKIVFVVYNKFTYICIYRKLYIVLTGTHIHIYIYKHSKARKLEFDYPHAL